MKYFLPFFLHYKCGDRINQRDNFSKEKYNSCYQNYIKALSITFLMRKEKVYVYRTEMFNIKIFVYVRILCFRMLQTRGKESIVDSPFAFYINLL